MALAVGIWLFNVSLLVNAGLGFYNIYFFKLFASPVFVKVSFEMAFLLPVTPFLNEQVWLALLIIAYSLSYYLFRLHWVDGQYAGNICGRRSLVGSDSKLWFLHYK